MWMTPRRIVLEQGTPGDILRRDALMTGILPKHLCARAMQLREGEVQQCWVADPSTAGNSGTLPGWPLRRNWCDQHVPSPILIPVGVWVWILDRWVSWVSWTSRRGEDFVSLSLACHTRMTEAN